MDPEFSLYVITKLRAAHLQIQFQGTGRSLQDNVNMTTVKLWAQKHTLRYRKLDGTTKADNNVHSASYSEDKISSDL